MNGYANGLIDKLGGIIKMVDAGSIASGLAELIEKPLGTALTMYYNYDDTLFNTNLYGEPEDLSRLMGKTQFEVEMFVMEVAAMCFAPKATVSINVGNNAANFINSVAGQLHGILTSTGAVQWVLVPGTVVTAGSTIAVGANVAGSLAALDMASSVGSGGGSTSKLYDNDGNYTGGRAQEELDALATDSTDGKITDGSRHEAEMGLDLEESGKLGKIERSSDPKTEFIDTLSGKKIEMKSFQSYPIGNDGKPITAPRNGAFTVENAMKNINKEIINGNDILVLDKTGLIDEHLSQLVDAIEKAEISDKIIWWPEG